MRMSVWMVAVMAVAAMMAARGAFGEGRDGVPCGYEPSEIVAMDCELPIGDSEGRAQREKRGLVLHYRFGRGRLWKTGARVRDWSQHGHRGQVKGDGLEIVEGIGKGGKAVRFDGHGDYIWVPRSVALESDELTLAVWLKVRAEAAALGDEGIGAVVFKRNTSFHDNEDYCLEIHPGRLLRTDLSSPRWGHAKVTTPWALEPELWHHVAVTVGEGEARIYVDGNLAVAKPHSAPLDHNQATDLLVGVRDHAQYPLSRFGMFDLFELKIWDKALGAEQVAALYAEWKGHPGVGRWEAPKALPAHDKFPTPLVASNVPPRGCGSRPMEDSPSRVFPEWKPVSKRDSGRGSESRLAAELSALVAQGRRDRAASPEFLSALEQLAKRYANAAETKPAPSDRLPMRADWQRTGWPAGWESVRRDVWTFGDGKARQNEAHPNTRYVLFYEPGKKWRDYAVKVRFESDRWLTPPSRSAAEVWVRCKGVDEAYRVEWCGTGDMAVISREGGGMERLIARAQVPPETVRDGKPWTVRVCGSEIAVEHEGRRYLEVNDSTHPEGSVGVESIHIPVSFDELEVEALPGGRN